MISYRCLWFHFCRLLSSFQTSNKKVTLCSSEGLKTRWRNVQSFCRNSSLSWYKCYFLLLPSCSKKNICLGTNTSSQIQQLLCAQAAVELLLYLPTDGKLVCFPCNATVVCFEGILTVVYSRELKCLNFLCMFIMSLGWEQLLNFCTHPQAVPQKHHWQRRCQH